MLLTSSPRARIAQHSTGWQVMRMITDRSWKKHVVTPAEWGRHRLITTKEAFMILEKRIQAIRSVMEFREAKPCSHCVEIGTKKDRDQTDMCVPCALQIKRREPRP